jgi:hypothetical protein
VNEWIVRIEYAFKKKIREHVGSIVGNTIQYRIHRVCILVMTKKSSGCRYGSNRHLEMN